jgi:hypothetical protein
MASDWARTLAFLVSCAGGNTLHVSHWLVSPVTAQSLVEFGDSLKQMADVKYALDDNVKQNFLEPLHQLQMKDLKEVMVSGGRK